MPNGFLPVPGGTEPAMVAPPALALVSWSASGVGLLCLGDLHLLLPLSDRVVLVSHPVGLHRPGLLLAELRGIEIAIPHLQRLHGYDELVFAEAEESATPDDDVLPA